ncbi:MAG: glutathione S-transferase N-terminal domain-containing protein [Rhodovarius sp.]|nr:glutathione S-transferase N-terminal domain-containing protein [Rhodovarius sp.]MDW8316051.1 glutathione S-transferase N-terminal domain-containing protein [Rhodovarius sp.]
MRLFYSPTSPFVRKVMVAAKLRGLAERIELIPCNPHESPPALLAANPLSKVPAMETPDAGALVDSLVICEYLDTLGDAPRLIPEAGLARVAVLQAHAIADGILDAAVARRGLSLQPVDDARRAQDARLAGAISRALAWFEARPLPEAMDLAAVTLGCALGYLDFRFGHEPWRPVHPRLADWFQGVSALPAFRETAPIA